MEEKILLELCEKVVELSPLYEYNSNDSDYTKCPFCKEWEYGNNGSMNTIKHDVDCGWLLALNTIKKIS